MRRSFTALLLLFALLVPATALAAEYLSAIADLPLATGLRDEAEKATVFDTPLGKVVNAYASGNVAPQAVLDFYDAKLPGLGWERQSSGTYHRKKETLKIDVAGPAEGPTHVSYTLSSQ